MHDPAVHVLAEGVGIRERDQASIRREHLAILVKKEAHDPLRLQVRISLHVGGMTADSRHLRGMVVAAEDEIDVFAQCLRQLAVAARELVCESEHHLAALLPQGLRLLPGGVDRVSMAHKLLVLEHRLTNVIRRAEHADLRRQLLITPKRSEWHGLHEILLRVLEQLAILVEQVYVQPRELGLPQALQHLWHAEVELVVAEGGRVQGQGVQDVDHLLPLEEVTQS
mmetsp:Transcript_73973/g.214269  ORF Transcript_73973/g.214269 Transcript_73973/m.214269 type:complete len:225 (-) Transcript_73973:704-1378(-)